MVKDKLKLRGDVAIVIKAADGSIKDTRNIHNLVVDDGLNFIVSRMKDTTQDAMTHMAVGSSTTAAAAGQTDLVSILGSREALDSTVVAANVVTYVSSFEAGEGTGAVTEAGIFNAASSGDMLCRTVFSVVNKGASDSMTITWAITLTAS
jgi:hypothetical protein|tara:strand:- start:217 stop:666 length:450 start_codon:yes stop_codon:yes gene_type:complete